MIKTLAAAAFAALVFATAASAPQRADARARLHVCKATSRVAYGVGYSMSLAQAKGIALVQCAARTPRGMVCRVRRCT